MDSRNARMLGQRLADRRQDLGLFAFQVAKHTMVDVSVLLTWELGRFPHPLSSEQIHRLADVLKMDPEEISTLQEEAPVMSQEPARRSSKSMINLPGPTPTPPRSQKSLGILLKQQRIATSHTQYDIAYHLNILVSAVNKWERNGIVDLSDYKLRKLCRFLALYRELRSAQSPVITVLTESSLQVGFVTSRKMCSRIKLLGKDLGLNSRDLSQLLGLSEIVVDRFEDDETVGYPKVIDVKTWIKVLKPTKQERAIWDLILGGRLSKIPKSAAPKKSLPRALKDTEDTGKKNSSPAATDRRNEKDRTEKGPRTTASYTIDLSIDRYVEHYMSWLAKREDAVTLINRLTREEFDAVYEYIEWQFQLRDARWQAEHT